MSELSAFDSTRFLSLVEARGLIFGKPLVFNPTSHSTNDDALASARNAASHGSLFVADEQTHGRGRRGNTWVSEARANLLFSLVLRPPFALESAANFSLAVGLAVRDALADFIPAHVLFKWPNDIYVGSQKLAGILIESATLGTKLQALVVGIGVNVHTRDFPAELAARSTSLALTAASVCEREVVLARICAALEARYSEYCTSRLSGMLAELAAYDVLYGKDVQVDGIRGQACGIAEDGCLLVQTPQGVAKVLSGNVVWRP